MSTDVFKRIRAKFSSKTAIDPATGFPVGMPMLPSTQRPLPLASPSNPQTDLATANSPFFQHLPAELRRLILIFAFGERTMHVDLSFRAASAPRRGRHCDADNERGSATNAPRNPKSAKLAWRWWGSTCHRGRPRPPPWALTTNVPGGDHDALWQDDCRRGFAACEAWPGPHPARCRVGALGWLRACRRAYREGVDVLYATNTLHMASAPLLLHLPRLLPRRPVLDAVASVELVWALREGDGSASRPVRPPRDVLLALAAVVPDALPNLVRLYLSVSWDLFRTVGDCPSAELVERTEREVVGPVDGMVLRLTRRRLRECTVEIPYSLFSPLQARERRSSTVPGSDRFWRTLPEEEQVADRGTNSAQTKRGYWVKSGCDDWPWSNLVCMAF